ncbi:hypothetical protein DFH09DRAFT_1079908 [Mycena vulgaris]|nr:hypothetical protein DFH09DRAFT_1079908 [Mycena vulgaris]
MLVALFFDASLPPTRTSFDESPQCQLDLILLPFSNTNTDTNAMWTWLLDSATQTRKRQKKNKRLRTESSPRAVPDVWLAQCVESFFAGGPGERRAEMGLAMPSSVPIDPGLLLPLYSREEPESEQSHRSGNGVGADTESSEQKESEVPGSNEVLEENFVVTVCFGPAIFGKSVPFSRCRARRLTRAQLEESGQRPERSRIRKPASMNVVMRRRWAKEKEVAGPRYQGSNCFRARGDSEHSGECAGTVKKLIGSLDGLGRRSMFLWVAKIKSYLARQRRSAEIDSGILHRQFYAARRGRTRRDSKPKSGADPGRDRHAEKRIVLLGFGVPTGLLVPLLLLVISGKEPEPQRVGAKEAAE